MLQEFNSTNELTQYLRALEERVKSLEAENRSLRAIPASAASVDANTIVRAVARALPQTGLLSTNFMTRAFTAWGYVFFANLIISAGFFVIYLCFMVVMVGLMSAGGNP